MQTFEDNYSKTLSISEATATPVLEPSTRILDTNNDLQRLKTFPPGLGKLIAHIKPEPDVNYIFTDGSCKFMGTSRTVAGVGVYFPKTGQTISKKTTHTTNNQAEF